MKKPKCPYCEKEFEMIDLKVRPFCSEQCKLLDLGNWLNESYTVPVINLDSEEEQDGELPNEEV